MTGPAVRLAWPLPVAIMLGIAALDAVAGLRSWPLAVAGLLDEPAHLGTAWLALAAVAARRSSTWLYTPALVASVAIDVDHIPLYLTGDAFAVNGGRPPTHSLGPVLLLLALGSTGPRMRWALGAAVGVLLHFARDVASGPGVPLLWPLTDASARVPYGAYLAVVVSLALLAATRSPAPSRPPWPALRRPHQRRRSRPRFLRRRMHEQPAREQSDPRR
jgi:inner membrane protein